MEARVRAFWIVLECPNCHKPQIINKWVQNGGIIDLGSVRSYECDLCEHPFEYQLQIREIGGDPHLASDSPDPQLSQQKD